MRLYTALFVSCALCVHTWAYNIGDIIPEVKLSDGRVLRNVEVISYTTGSLVARWEGGRGAIAYVDLPREFTLAAQEKQKRLAEKKVQEVTKREAEAPRVKYHPNGTIEILSKDAPSEKSPTSSVNTTTSNPTPTPPNAVSPSAPNSQKPSVSVVNVEASKGAANKSSSVQNTVTPSVAPDPNKVRVEVAPISQKKNNVPTLVPTVQVVNPTLNKEKQTYTPAQVRTELHKLTRQEQETYKKRGLVNGEGLIILGFRQVNDKQVELLIGNISNSIQTFDWQRVLLLNQSGDVLPANNPNDLLELLEEREGNLYAVSPPKNTNLNESAPGTVLYKPEPLDLQINPNQMLIVRIPSQGELRWAVWN